MSDGKARFCSREKGHRGSHANGAVTWSNIVEPPVEQDGSGICTAARQPLGATEPSRCTYPEGHYGDHFSPEAGFWINVADPVPTKQREGDQVLPDTRDGQQCVQDRIIAEMQESKRVGLERYGSVLMTFNGRRSIQDVREEARDLFVYLTQVTMEVEATRETLVALAASVIDEKVGAVFSGQTGQNVAQEVAEAVVDRLLGHFSPGGES